jgi:4-hydroxy-tetrahydrodipicolinate synthase
MAYLASGGDGCISTIANPFPGLCQGIYASCAISHMPVSTGLSSRIATLGAVLSADSSVPALKFAMSMLGFMKPAVRLPLVELGENEQRAVALTIAAIREGDQAAFCEHSKIPVSRAATSAR